MRAFPSCLTAACLAAFSVAGPVLAQEAQGAHVSIELNALEPVEDACRISFVVQNGHEVDIEKAVFEAVLFDRDGRVDRLTLFDFGTLPASRPRVRQFIVPALDCAALGRLLINGAQTCTAEGLPPTACSDALDLRSRTDVEVTG